MSGVFGSSNATDVAHISSLRIQTSCYGTSRAVVLGKARVTGNLLWYGDLRAIRHEESQGGKGGGVSTTSYTYRYSLIVGIAEQVAGVGKIWMVSGDDKYDLSAADNQYSYSLNLGGRPNSYSSILEARHPNEFFRYPGLANFVAVDLGEFSAEVPPSFSFEAYCADYDVSIGGIDPAIAADRIITNAVWGAGAPASYFPRQTAYGDYAVAMGWAIGLELAEQKTAAEWLGVILDQTNAAAVWAATHLEIVPYGDTAISANGRTWTPDVTPCYSLTDDDFLGDLAEPILVDVKSDTEIFNIQPVEYKDRANEYNTASAEGSDPASVAMDGAKKNTNTVSAHGLQTASAATRLGTVKIQRILRTVNGYTFSLPWRFCRLLGMDIVLLTDDMLGMDEYPVRLTSVIDSPAGEIKCEAEDYPVGAGHAPLIAAQESLGYNRDVNVDPGDCNPPVIFDAPAYLTGGAQEIWIGSSGGENWGGATIWVSTDGDKYKAVGTLPAAIRQGVLTSQLLAVSDPDSTSTLAVDLTTSRATLVGGAQADADNLNTLCYVDGEFLAYRDAALTSQYQYQLTHLRRGACNSLPEQHFSGAQFARIDTEAFFKYSYPAEQTGATVYIKLTARNIFGAHEQALDDVEPVVFTPGAVGAVTYDSWMPVPDSPVVFASADSTGHVSRAKIKVTFPEELVSPVDGLALFVSATPWANKVTLSAGGTSGTVLTVSDVSVVASGVMTILAGSSAGKIVTTTLATPLDTSTNLGGRYWAKIPGSTWTKCTGIDATGYLFDPAFDATPAAGQSMDWVEVSWADERQGNKLAILQSGSAHEVISWESIDDSGPNGEVQIAGVKRAQEGTTAVNASGATLHYYPAPGAGTVIVAFPASSFAQETSGAYVAEAEVNVSVPPGYYCSMSAAVYKRKPNGAYVRSAIVPATFGGPL